MWKGWCMMQFHTVKLCFLCWLSPEIKRCIYLFCYVFLIGFQLCDIIAVTWPFQKDFHLVPNLCWLLKSAEKNDFQPVTYWHTWSRLNCPFETCSDLLLQGQLWSICLDVAWKLILKTFYFWFQAPTKYGIKVSWPNKLSIFIFIPYTKSPPLFYT